MSFNTPQAAQAFANAEQAWLSENGNSNFCSTCAQLSYPDGCLCCVCVCVYLRPTSDGLSNLLASYGFAMLCMIVDLCYTI